MLQTNYAVTYVYDCMAIKSAVDYRTIVKTHCVTDITDFSSQKRSTVTRKS